MLKLHATVEVQLAACTGNITASPNCYVPEIKKFCLMGFPSKDL